MSQVSELLLGERRYGNQGEIHMRRVDKNTFVITTSPSGRVYYVHRRNRPSYRAAWDVCNSSGGWYGSFASLPGARRWVMAN